MSILTEGAERETIARIIDPGAFADRDNNVGPRDRTIKLAFDKADSILALRDHAPTRPEPDEWDGLDCTCGGGSKVGHANGCPEAAADTSASFQTGVLVDAITATIADNVYVDNDGVAGCAAAAEAIVSDLDRQGLLTRSTASSDKPHDAGSFRKLAFDMTCDQQFRLASFVAQNVGYVIEPEPGFPDEPDNATSIDAPLDVLAEAEIALDLACLLLGNHHAASQYKSVSDALVKIRGALATPTPSDAMIDVSMPVAWRTRPVMLKGHDCPAQLEWVYFTTEPANSGYYEKEQLYAIPATPPQAVDAEREILKRLYDLGNNTKDVHYKVMSQSVHRIYSDFKAILATRPSPSPAAVEAWQPISTAPNDGTHLTLYEINRGAFEGWWHDAWPRAFEQYWMDCADSEPDPTHWRPLIAPPIPRDGRGGQV